MKQQKMKSTTIRINEIECAIIQKALQMFINQNAKQQFDNKLIKYALALYYKARINDAGK